MDRKLLIIGGLIGFIILFSAFIFIPFGLILIDEAYNDPGYNSSEDNSSYDPSKEYLSFDNSTPQATAISITRLNYGLNGFYPYNNDGNYIEPTAYLTSDGKYWIVNMGYSLVTVDAKTWMSKKNDTYEPDVLYDPKDTWRSLDELKATYIADIQRDGEETVGKPQKITMDGKEIWKVPIHEYIHNYNGIEIITHIKDEPVGHVYVDLETGKSKFVYSNIFNKIICDIFNMITGTDGDGWLTLKEVDKDCNLVYPFRDALRDLYPE